jgi:hypothetical protein
MMKSMKKLLLITAIAVMVVSLAAPAAMAEEVQDHPKDPSGAEPVVVDHPESSSNNSSDIAEKEKQFKEEEEDSAPQKPQVECIKAPCPGSNDSSAPQKPQVECIKAPCPGSNDPICLLPEGCDPSDEPTCLLPEGCDNKGDEPTCFLPEGCDTDEKPYQDPGIRKCDLLPIECPDEEDEEENKEDEEDSIVCIAIYVVKDGKCVLPYDALYDEEEEASAPGGMKTISVSAPVDEAGQTTDSGTIHGCPFDYEYIEDIDMCLPAAGDYEIFETLFGDTPWPDSAGGYVALLGDLVEDPVVGAGAFVQLGLGYVEDALVWYGEDFGIAGWPFLGIGYTIGFAGDAVGAVIGGVGEAAGAVADGVGEAIDAVGDAAGAVYDEISSWF